MAELRLLFYFWDVSTYCFHNVIKTYLYLMDLNFLGR